MIDWKFIENVEGAHVLKGYIPLDRFGYPIGNSGVTISTGVDIGQMDRSQLVKLLKNQEGAFELTAKLLPYVGLVRMRAVQALEKRPLEITRTQSDILSMVMHREVLTKLSKLWLDETGAYFEELPSQVQTVLFSLAYNFGINLPKYYPNTWDAFMRSFKSDDWSIAGTFLLNFPSKQKQLDERRHKEGRLLMGIKK